jgi:hypothetical protein
MVTIQKVMEKHYIVKVGDMYFDLYIDLNEDGNYECFFFDEYMEAKTINELKNRVKKFITNHN